MPTRCLQTQIARGRGHDLLWVDIAHRAPPTDHQTRRERTRRQPPKAPLQQTDTHQAVSDMAKHLTVPGKASDRYRESTELKQARQAARAAPAHEARTAWKHVTRLRQHGTGKSHRADAITHELLWALTQEPQWTARILHMMNDFLCKGSYRSRSSKQ